MRNTPAAGQQKPVRLRLGIILLCTALASGCTGQKFGNPLAKLGTAKKQQQIAQQQPPNMSEEIQGQGDEDNPSQLANSFTATSDDLTTGSIAGSDAMIGQGDNKVQRIANTISPSCRRILAEAGIETTMLRSPIINGSINSDQDVNVGASYDLLDLRRASLKEELALLRCSRDDAAAKLTQLLVTSNQSLSQAGYRAKADYLKRRKKELAAIRREAARALDDGELTVFRANALSQSITRVQSDAAKAEQEAQKRQVVRNIQGQSYQQLDRRLEQTEQRIQILESQMRSADALKLKASLGYAQRGESSDDITISSDGEVSAKFAVSMRLGAYSPRRFELEDIARTARTDSLYESNRGILWRTREAARANGSVVNGLRQQRKNVQMALASAKDSASAGARSYRPELLFAHLKGRIDVVRLSAELAALDATLADTSRLDANLTFRK